MVRLATWNCNMAFRKKQDAILAWDPDVLVVPECEDPERVGEWSEFTDWRWTGEDEHKGLAVFTRNDVTIDGVASGQTESRHVLPVEIDGAPDIFAIWAMNAEHDPKRRYIAQLYTALIEYATFLEGDTVVAGDYNWNHQWDDSPNGPLYGTLEDVVARLHDMGLESAYHRLRDVTYGAEPDPTFFMHKKRDRGYHIDYVFSNRGRLNGAEIRIGDYDEWVDASDHVPLLVDLA
ncbi:endonuclease/exonuclease/phosphatase family protein [Halarchaeum grantii]|uniref:Endonuclease/exonuclease/phosphatase family protein n=1 Tax=Halarchaeum grantii TaxID=1193105 RepID=A0A830F672_9EURY|nr:endonuclease/exonuclease/phosphatase family protein [Halarchaeum grantii]GGL43155.1 endonuclease/exonuclease/phosphatase family protein [Halarchaeum grantii]